MQEWSVTTNTVPNAKANETMQAKRQQCEANEVLRNQNPLREEKCTLVYAAG